MASQRARRPHLEPRQEPKQAQPEPDGQSIQQLQQDIARMAQAIGERGVQLDRGLINTTSQAQAACEMLVTLGLCAPEAMDALVLRNVKSILANVLQRVEETQLQAERQQRGVQVVERPKLLVAKH